MDHYTERRTDMGVFVAEHHVDYMGVRLPKAKVASEVFVPDAPKEYYADEFFLQFQREVAVSLLLGDPMYIEGGTSIGKTTTIKKMAAELNWEVHYNNLNGQSDTEELMGRWVPNPNRKTNNDPEHIFVDGKITSGLRPEPGKVKIIILDEFNAAQANILVRLHEVHDALQSNGRVVIKEKEGTEIIRTDRGITKLIALGNTPGQGFFGKEPLDPAQLRRWVYMKAPAGLPKDTFAYAVDAAFGLAPMEKPGAAKNIERYESRDKALTREEIAEIPGIKEILALYKEFHSNAKLQAEKRKVGADQPQRFSFDDQMERTRVRDYIARFYDGDITETMQQALRYYYANKLESVSDRNKLNEAIEQVVYKPPRPSFSQRQGLAESREKKDKTPRFSTEQREELERMGFTIYSLDGNSLSEMEAQGVEITGEINFSRHKKGIRGDVAIPQRIAFNIMNTKDMNTNDQMQLINEWANDLDVSGLRIMLGSAADYIAIFEEEDKSGENTLSTLMTERNLHFRTSTTYEGEQNRSSVVRKESDRSYRGISFEETATHQKVVALPLIVPRK